MKTVGLEFVLCGFRQEPGRGGINLDIGITNFVGCLTGTVVRNDVNINGWDASAIQLSGNKILARSRGRGKRR